MLPAQAARCTACSSAGGRPTRHSGRSPAATGARRRGAAGPGGAGRRRLDRGRSLDELNRNSPFKPVFFDLDSAELDDPGRAIVGGNAELLKKYSAWVITVEGHADERGTAEYNLALGERRAVAVKTYLISLGVAPDRVRTVSYGKEFPFDPGHNEAAWSKNRRAHFVITSK